MNNAEQRMKLLEDQYIVMQREINEVLGEVQTALTGMQRANTMVFAVMSERLRALEKLAGIDIDATGTAQSTTQITEGKEL